MVTNTLLSQVAMVNSLDPRGLGLDLEQVP